MNADSLLHWLMRTSLEATVLILAVLGLRWALGRRLSPAWRIGLWMLVGAKLMLPAFVPAGFGLGAWLKSAEDVTPVVARQDGLEAQPPSQAQTAVLAVREVAQADGSVARSWSVSPKIALLWVWLAGAAGLVLVALARQRRFERMLRARRPATDATLITLVARLAQRADLKKAVRMVLMPAGTAPAMVGVRQPTLLLPEDWQARFDERSLRHVVLHELFHVKQGDLVWNWIALAVQALHWFNPLVWFVVSRFQADRELRCDAGALALLAPAERLDYGHTLLRIQATFFAPPAIAGLAPCVRNHPALRQRILMIAAPTTRQPWLQALLVLTLSVLVCYSFTTTAHAQEKEVPPKVRTRDTERGGSGAAPAREEDGKKPGATERDGDGERKPGMRDGDGERKPGMRDGDGERKPGAREGDGAAKKPGMREGDGERGSRGAEQADVRVNFPDATVRKVVSFYSELTGRQVAVESGIENEPAHAVAAEPLSKRDATAFIEASLLLNGYALVADGAKYRLIKQDPNAPAPKKVASAEGGERKPGMRDGEKPRTGERDGERPRSGERDGEKPRAGREGEGERKPGMRDGEKPRTGARDGEKPRTGARDGEGERKPGMRDGEKPRAGGERDGEGRGKSREGSAATSSSGETITLHVTKNGEVVRIGDEEISMNRLRGHLSTFLPEHPGAKVIVTGDSDVPLGALHNTVDAVRDNGNKNVGIKAE